MTAIGLCVLSTAWSPVGFAMKVESEVEAEEKEVDEKKEAAVVWSRTRRCRDQRKHKNPTGAGKRNLEQLIATAPWKRARIACCKFKFKLTPEAARYIV